VTFRHRPALLAAIGMAVLAVGGSIVLLTTRGDATAAPADVLGPGPVTVRLDVEHSRFVPERVKVRPHTEVRFVVVNRDPIRHELIVGDDELHARHQDGTEAEHPPRPGEVSVDPKRTASTTATFHEPGVVLYACHLPGHFAYGMKGTVVVVAP
jgi:plastocyanin